MGARQGLDEAAEVDLLVRQPRGIDENALADQVRDRLQLAIGLRVLRVAPAVEADGGAYDPVLQIEAEELAALGPAAEHQLVPGGREADVLDQVLVLIRPDPSKAATESSSANSTPFSRWMSASTRPTSSPRTRASGARWPSTATTSTPSWRSEADPSEPMKPSPITTARRPGWAAARMRSQSSTVRSWKT